MGLYMELKRLKADFNYLIGRINKAEMLEKQGEFENISDSRFNRLSSELTVLIFEAAEISNKIENILGRPLTTKECLNGIEER